MGQTTAKPAEAPAETPTEIPNEVPPTVNQVMKRVGFWGIAALMVGVGIFGLQGRNRSLSYTTTTSVIANEDAAGPYLSVDSAAAKKLHLTVAVPHQKQRNSLHVQQVRQRGSQIQVAVTYSSTHSSAKPGYDVIDLSVPHSFKPGTYQLVVTIKQKRGIEPSSVKLADPVELSSPIVIDK